MQIKTVMAREILDSRGNPTVEADVVLDDGTMGRASVPSGASTGAHEACELRDNEPTRYGGKGVSRAVDNVRGEIARAVIGKDPRAQREIDEAMISLDGTENKSRLGANAILAVSLASAHAAAKAQQMHLFEHIGTLAAVPRAPLLPLPQCNIVNGGAHTSWESTDIQEFMIMPTGAASFREGVRALSEVFHSLKGVLAGRGYGTTVGDEGGFAPHVKGGNEEVFELISTAIHKAQYSIGKDIAFATDVAASEFYENGEYKLPISGLVKSSDDMIAWYKSLKQQYPILSIEDGLGEEDWQGWARLNASMGDAMQLVGDDLFVTNVRFLARGVEQKAANAILIKVNQIGTLTETVDAVDMAHRAGWRAIVSHRSGETEDTTIAHLVVGLGTGQIKTGSVSRAERTGKYNELLRIEEILGEKAVYAGGDAFK